MLHYTNKKGYNAIASQETWLFKASQPRAAHQPVGAYFTTYLPGEPGLCKKLFIPRAKTAYVFAFRGMDGLQPIPGNRGRLRRIFYAPSDYSVTKPRQLYGGVNGVT